MRRTASLTVPIGPRDHVLGPDNAPVSMVEYGDFECPFCGQAYPIVAELIQRYGNRMRYAFRHFPLATAHPYAEKAAEAAEAAGAQGKFWEMHNILYTHQDALDPDSLTEYAATIDLDLPRFTRELAEGVHALRVREDFRSGIRSGVNGTPSFFINGFRHDGGYDYAELAAAIEAAGR